MRIGYGKLGRTIGLGPTSWGPVAGDNEPPILLNKMAREHPEHTFVLLGRNSGEVPTDVGLPSNVENPFIELRDELKSVGRGNHSPMTLEELYRTAPALIKLWIPTFDSLDGIIMWQGQHGTSNYPIPKTGDATELTRPQDSFIYYAGMHFAGINRWTSVDPMSRRVVWLCADARNYLKGRDLAWPPRDVLAQFNWSKKEKHWRYNLTGSPQDYEFDGDWSKEANVWHVNHPYLYSQLEIVGIPTSLECSYDWDGRDRFGIIINEARSYVKLNRKDAVRDWVLPLKPSWVRGKWSPKSIEQLQQHGEFDPAPVEWYAQWPLLHSIRSTFTTPSSGSGWATTKPWESFGCGTVCFFHPQYDTQGHVIPTLEDVHEGRVDDDPDLVRLVQWLRVETPEQLEKRVKVLDEDRDAWLWIVQAQRRLFDRAMETRRCMKMIQERLKLGMTSS